MQLPKPPSFRLDGKRALVTGAGRGIGLAAAAALAEAGAAVTLVARSSDELEAAARAIRAAGGQAEALALDVTDFVAFTEALAARPPHEVFVNNAGTNRPKHFTDVTVDDFDTIFGLNVRAAFFAAQAVARRLIEAGKGGSIINMSSQMGHVGGRNRTVYCASKAALEGMTKAMALDLGSHGIRVNTVCPTFIETEMTRPFLSAPGFRDEVLAKIPLGRLGAVADVAGAVLYLASDAAALTTGSALMVDGGWTAA